MEFPNDIPFLSKLSKVELAKIIPNLELVSLDEGGLLDPKQGLAEGVYCIKEGWAEVVVDTGKEVVLLMVLGPGDSFGPLTGEAVTPSPGIIRARTPAKLVRISKSTFRELTEKHPNVLRAVSDQLSHRVSTLEKELVRVKLILAAHAEELWGAFPDGISADIRVHEEAAHDTIAAAKSPAVDLPAFSPPRPNLLRTASQWLIPASLIGMMAAHYILGLSPLSTLIAVLIWGTINWYVGIIPDYGVALAMVGALAILHLSPVNATLSGFTNETWFLILGIYGLGTAVNRTGLLYRFALLVLRKLPPTYGGQTLALALTGLILTPALPSSNGRVTMASPLAQELVAAMGLEQGSGQSTGLVLSVLHGFGQMFFLFMNGTGNCLVIWALLPPEIRGQVNWFYWLWVAFPLGLIIFVGFYLAMLVMIPGKSDVRISRRILEIQAATLGPMSEHERRTLAVVVFVLLGFMLQPIHGVHPAWPAITGLLVLTALKIVDRTAFVSNIDWASLILFGSLWSLAGIIRDTGLDASLSAYAAAVLEPVSGRPWLFLSLLGIMTFLVRMVIPWESAIPLMMVAATPVLLASGYNPFIGGLTILATSNPFFVPQQNVVYLTAYQSAGEGNITHRHAARFGLVHAGITLTAIIVSSLYWGVIGVMWV